jgi:hypothetical protein
MQIGILEEKNVLGDIPRGQPYFGLIPKITHKQPLVYVDEFGERNISNHQTFKVI